MSKRKDTGSLRITKSLLQEHGACESQVRIFCREWPDGAAATRENIDRAMVLGLSIEWLECLLTAEPRRVYAAAMAEPLRVYNAALAENLALALET